MRGGKREEEVSFARFLTDDLFAPYTVGDERADRKRRLEALEKGFCTTNGGAVVSGATLNDIFASVCCSHPGAFIEMFFDHDEEAGKFDFRMGLPRDHPPDAWW